MSDRNPYGKAQKSAVAMLSIAAALAGVLWAWCASPCTGQEIVYPTATADGTLADGFAGPFDGVVDDCDWRFNDSNYDGAITLIAGVREYRVVFEYDLSGVTVAPPVSATMSVTMRGPPLYPVRNADVHVYSYPADLAENCDASDFSDGPTVLTGIATVARQQPPTLYTLDVSSVVNQALGSGSDMVALRFQIDPATPYSENQAYIDALDADPTTKPYITVTQAPPSPGDFDGDGDVDLDDFGSFAACYNGSSRPPAGTCPPGVDADLDGDGDVDLDDFAIFAANYTGSF